MATTPYPYARQATACYCPRCGRHAGWQGQGFARMPDRRVLDNLKPLAIVWLVYGAYRVLTAALAAVALTLFGQQGMFGNVPAPVQQLAGVILPALGVVTVALAVASVLTGVGLLTRAPWARTMAIVMGILALLHPPLGTAVGIYTLWVMGPRRSSAEWQALQVG